MKTEETLETYLNRATSGVPRHKRLEITQELVGHIEARVQDFKLGGLSDAEALRQTLRELGAPSEVSTGMRRVYLWPGLTRTGSLLGLFSVAAIYTLLHLSSVMAQVQGYHPSFTPLPGPYTYVDTLSLRDELQKVGVKVSGDLTQPTLNLPGVNAAIQVRARPEAQDGFINRTLVRDYATGRDFIDLNAVVRAVSTQGVAVQVEGWLNPKLHLGSVTLPLGTADQPLEAYNLYHVALEPLAGQLGADAARSSREDDVAIASTHTLKASAGAGVYALVSMQRRSSVWRGSTPPVLYYDLAQPDASGLLHFKMQYDQQHLRLTSQPNTLQADAAFLRENPANVDYASAGRPAQALLLKLNGNLSGQTYQIVPQDALSVGSTD